MSSPASRSLLYGNGQDGREPNQGCLPFRHRRPSARLVLPMAAVGAIVILACAGLAMNGTFSRGEVSEPEVSLETFPEGRGLPGLILESGVLLKKMKAVARIARDEQELRQGGGVEGWALGETNVLAGEVLSRGVSSRTKDELLNVLEIDCASDSSVIPHVNACRPAHFNATIHDDPVLLESNLSIPDESAWERQSIVQFTFAKTHQGPDSGGLVYSRSILSSEPGDLYHEVVENERKFVGIISEKTRYEVVADCVKYQWPDWGTPIPDKIAKMKISNHLRKALDVLPSTCDDRDYEVYKELFETWGDHFHTGASLGSYELVGFMFDRQEINRAQIKLDVLLESLKEVRKGLTTPGYEPKIDSAVAKLIKGTVSRYHGGIAELIPTRPEDYAKWQDSTVQYPAVTRRRLVPLHTLLAGEPQIQACMGEMMLRYRTEAAADALRQIYVNQARVNKRSQANWQTVEFHPASIRNKDASWHCESAAGYLLSTLKVHYGPPCSSGERDGGMPNMMVAVCFKIWTIDPTDVLRPASGGGGHHITSVSYPARAYTAASPPRDLRCPSDSVAVGLAVQYGGLMDGACKDDGGVVNGMEVKCRALNDFMTAPKGMKLDMCQMDSKNAVTVGFDADVYTNTRKEIDCPDGSAVEGMTVSYGGDCQGKCLFSPIRSIHLHCRMVSDYFC